MSNSEATGRPATARSRRTINLSDSEMLLLQHIGGGERKAGAGIQRLIQGALVGGVCPQCNEKFINCEGIKKVKEVSIQERWNLRVAESLRRFPSLSLGLSDAQLSQVGLRRFGGLTQHQIEACKLAGAIACWHPQYVLEMCPAKRPPLFRDSCSTDRADLRWEDLAQAWEDEQNTPLEELAQKWADEMASNNVIRLLEPISWMEGVRISAHDEREGKMPCSVEAWK